MKTRKKLAFSTTQIILLSFLITILIGSVLLALPVSSASGEPVSYLDALFTATTSTCVTGLVTLPSATTWSLFGQIVILILIQIGGLGVITIVSGIMMLLNYKLGVRDRLLIQDAFNLNTMSGLKKFVGKVFLGSFIIEGLGALVYMTVLVPEFGAKGIFMSVFNSVSAFCNAGIDIIGENSLCNYATNPIINTVTSALIILGGLGYIVWWDIIRTTRDRGLNPRKFFRHLTLHSKIAIVASLVLILAGGVLIFALEYSNPLTIGDMSLFDKIQVSLFQSVTTRTAGFASVPQENLTNAASMVSLILMMIGGSPVGTAGGIKTVTFAVLFCSAVATVKNKTHATLFGRSVSDESIRKALAVTFTFIAICLTSTVLLLATQNAPPIDVIYETVSATATVGLSRNFSSTMDALGKIIIIVTMYLGRVGPISLAVALGGSSAVQNVIVEPTEDISIG